MAKKKKTNIVSGPKMFMLCRPEGHYWTCYMQNDETDFETKIGSIAIAGLNNVSQNLFMNAMKSVVQQYAVDCGAVSTSWSDPVDVTPPEEGETIQ